MVSKFSWARSTTKKKKEAVSPDLMVIFWLKYKDHLGNPWFLPTDEWGIQTNYDCIATKEQFDTALRAYASNK